MMVVTDLRRFFARANEHCRHARVWGPVDRALTQ